MTRKPKRRERRNNGKNGRKNRLTQKTLAFFGRNELHNIRHKKNALAEREFDEGKTTNLIRLVVSV